LACHDAAATPYPLAWRTDPTRAVRLAAAFEAVRAALGSPVLVVSGYRTPAHNAAVGGRVRSQHLEGRAVDVVGVRGVSVADLYAVARAVAVRDRVIRGLGRYPTFVHVDVRPSVRLVEWVGGE
jgi:uncharacterized protein YcbK (DUF882 family)